MTPDRRRYTAGWMPEGSVRALIEDNPAVWEALPEVLISSVDSHRDIGEMPWVREQVARDPGWASSIAPLVISGRSLVGAARTGRVFAGFDEVWVPGRQPVAIPPSEAYLVSPRYLSEGVPQGVIRWMNHSECRLGVGDGEGLNFVARDRELAEKLGLRSTGS